MPHCSVINCKNSSQNATKQSHNVSYHSFPDDPHLKSLWIAATGRYDWFPQKHNKICSQHFADVFIVHKKTRRFLLPDAVPKLLLHPLFDEGQSSNNTDAEIDKWPLKRLKTDSNDQKEESDDINCDARTNVISLEIQELKSSLAKSKKIVQRQHKQIKQLQEKNRRLLKKIESFGSIIKSLRDNWLKDD